MILTISWTNLSMSVLGPRSKSQWLFLEEHSHRSGALIYRPILILYHTNVQYDNTLDKYDYKRCRAKVKFTGYFKKNISFALAPLNMD